MKSILPHLIRVSLFATGLAFVAGCAHTGFKPEPGSISLFNGKDLTGWGYVTNNFNGKTASMDGRFTARDGILTVNPFTGPRKFQQLSTTASFPKNFVLKLEFRAGVGADSGIFIRNRSCNAAITG